LSSRRSRRPLIGIAPWSRGQFLGLELSFVEKSWSGKWIAPDFRGHGKSQYSGPYGYASHASDIATLIESEGAKQVYIVGHSFGGVVGAIVGTGWFGPSVSRLYLLGVKLNWSTEEIVRAHALASKPVKVFATRAEAVDRYLKGSGLYGLLSPDCEEASQGTLKMEQGYRVAMDPRVLFAVGPSIPSIFSQVAVPFRLAAGSNDPMVSYKEMLELDSHPTLFEGAGHNVHYENADLVWREVTAEFC
jgi:pimeloyl-ACP methyl ester carboxylesterase